MGNKGQKIVDKIATRYTEELENEEHSTKQQRKRLMI